MTILVGIGAAIAGFAACWAWLRPRLAERERQESAHRDELARREGELETARNALVDARAGAAAAAARLETLEEKLPETVRSISLETLDASREALAAFRKIDPEQRVSNYRPIHLPAAGRVKYQEALRLAGLPE